MLVEQGYPKMVLIYAAVSTHWVIKDQLHYDLCSISGHLPARTFLTTMGKVWE